jgi:hypothetical protein
MPARDDRATIACPICDRVFAAFGRGRYRSDGCRKKAWRRRHQPARIPTIVPGPGVPRRPITVYECVCGYRALGEQRCEECGSFMSRVGVGGLCPNCDAPVAVTELLDQHTTLAVCPAATKGGRR